MVNEGKEIDIYRTFKKAKVDKRKVAIIILSLVILLLLILILMHTVRIIKASKIYKQYEEQITNLKYQQELKEEELRQAKIPKLTEEGQKNIESIYHSNYKRAFLTFDDGPSTVTDEILDILKQEDVKATFFVLGSKVKEKPDEVKRMYDEGHYIANHGYTHIYENIYASPDAVLNEFNMCNDEVRKAINVPEYNSYLFRFPGGLSGGKYEIVKSQANELLKQNNIVHVDWNALTGDAETNDLTIDFELSRLKETTENKNSVVILMHDAPIKKVTAEALPQIIAYLKGQGYSFENFYNIIK